jgi:uncharacterized integral membrane protein
MSATKRPPSVPDDEKARRPRSKRDRTRTAALVVLAVFITVFAVLNLEEVHVNWIFGSGKAPLIIVILISLIVGGLIVYVAERRPGRHK